MRGTRTASDIIGAFNRGREPERLAMKYKAMRDNAFVFLRGSAHLYYARYVEAGHDASAPVAWCCNDLHLENFGTYLGDNGLTYFDVNDFDEAGLAPADWDIVRLATSILVAATPLEIAGARSIELARTTITAYLAEMAAGKPRWLERKTADGPIGELIDELRKRDDTAILDKRTVKRKGRRRLDVDGKRTLHLEAGEHDALAAFFAALPAEPGQPPGFYRLLDAARRVAGTGSLGLARFVVLVEGAGSPDGNVLLDLKAAAPSAVSPLSPCRQPRWADEAERVVRLQGRGQAVTPAYLRAVRYGGQPFIMKMLQPTTDRLDLARLARSHTDFEHALERMANLAAWSQLRSSGRQGSAIADDLIGMGTRRGLAASLLDRARAMAEVVVNDFSVYADAYDAGRMVPA